MSQNNKKIRSGFSKFLSIFLSVLFGLVFIVFAYSLFCNVTGRIAYVGNYAYIRVLTDSMEPTIPAKSFIMVEKVSPQEISEEDVIVFTSTDPSIYGKNNTHRVKKITETSEGLVFTTKGDHNSVEDKYTVNQSAVKGRYVKNLPALTSVYNFVSNPIVFGLLLFIPACVLVIISIKDVVVKAKEVKTDVLVEKEVDRLKREGYSEDDLDSEAKSDGVKGEAGSDSSKNDDNKDGE